jgi:hypothetical protein
MKLSHILIAVLALLAASNVAAWFGFKSLGRSLSEGWSKSTDQITINRVGPDDLPPGFPAGVQGGFPGYARSGEAEALMERATANAPHLTVAERVQVRRRFLSAAAGLHASPCSAQARARYLEQVTEFTRMRLDEKGDDRASSLDEDRRVSEYVQQMMAQRYVSHAEMAEAFGRATPEVGAMMRESPPSAHGSGRPTACERLSKGETLRPMSWQEAEQDR